MYQSHVVDFVQLKDLKERAAFHSFSAQVFYNLFSRLVPTYTKGLVLDQALEDLQLLVEFHQVQRYNLETEIEMIQNPFQC